MRTTSFCKAAVSAVFLCCTWVSSHAQVPSSSKDIAVDESAPVQDLGVSEVESYAIAETENPGTDYMEIMPSAWEGLGLSASEVISSLSGIQGYKQGGMGSFQTVSIRGIAARNVLICIDGIPLNDAGGGAADLGAIDLNNIERIEVYKDRVPAKFGGAGIGGAINFVTKDALHSGSTPRGRVIASYGSHNTFEGSVQVSAGFKDSVQFSATASMRHSDNDYEFDNRNGTRYNDEDDFKDRRRNAEFTEYSGNIQYRMLHGNGAFSVLSASAMRTQAGNPGMEDLQTYVAEFTGDMAQVAYRLEFPTIADVLLLTAGVTGKFEKNMSSSYYPLDKIGFPSNYFSEYGLAGYRAIPEISANLLLDKFEAYLRLAGSAELWESRGSLESFDLDRFAGSIAGNAEYCFTDWFSLFAEGNILKTYDDIGGGQVMTTGLETVDEATQRDLSLAGMVQAKFGKKNSWIGGNVSFGRFYRKPQLMELYGVYPGLLSNPTLKDESALRFVAGLSLATPKNRSVLRATYFENHVENGIYWVTTAYLMKAFNIDKALIRGVELELESRPVKFFQAVLRGTIQNPRDEGASKAYNGNLLPGEPVHSYFAEGTFFLPYNLSAMFQATYRTRIFISDRTNSSSSLQPPVARYNASLAWQPWQKTKLMFTVDNISDETYRSIYTPYPAPGREYRFTLIQGF